MDYLVWVWVGVACVSAAVELFSMQMVAVWFTFSGVVAAILSILGVVWWIQILVFCVLSLVLILSLRKFSLKFLLKNTNQKTNSDSFIGTNHKLLDPIEPESPGTIKINGVVWTAICEKETESIEKDTVVEIKKVEGNKLVVSKKE